MKPRLVALALGSATWLLAPLPSPAQTDRPASNPEASTAVSQAAGPSTTLPTDVPLALDRAVDLAIDRNLDLMAQRFDVDLAAAQVVTAGLRANPTLTLGADYQDLLGSHFQNDPSTGAGPPEYNARLDYPFDLAGKRRKRLAVARADRTVSELLLANAVRELVFAVRSTGIDVLRNTALLELGRRQLATLEGVVAINAVRVRDGDLAVSELARTRLAARQVAGAIRLAEVELAKSRTDLGLLLASPIEAPPVDVEGPIPSARLDVSLEGLRAEARAARPDLRALEQARGRADADLSLQRALAVTDLGVGLQYHRQTAYAKGDALGFFLSGTLPTFDRNQGEIQRARSSRKQADARLAAARAAIDAEVLRAVATYRAARERLAVFEGGALDEATEVRDAAEYAYRRGEASFVEFLDAQRAFIDTSRSYYESLADHARARYALEYVSGRGAGEAPDDAPGGATSEGIIAPSDAQNGEQVQP